MPPPLVQIKRTENYDKPPTGLAPGELCVEMGIPTRLWVGVPPFLDATGKKLLYDSSVVIGAGDFYTRAESDGRFVNITGDNMTGDLNNTASFSGLNLTATSTVYGVNGSYTGTVWTGELAATGNVTAGSGVVFYGNTGQNLQWTGVRFNLTNTLDVQGNIYAGAVIEANGAGNESYISTREVGGGRGLLFGVNGPNSYNEIVSSVIREPRWSMRLGNATPESGGSSGSDFDLSGCPDAGGGARTAAISITRASSDFYAYSANCYKPGGGAWIDLSDARIKDVSAPYEHGLAELRQLNPVRYTFKGNVTAYESPLDADDPAPKIHGLAVGKEFIGLVAQEAEQPMPELVRQVEGWIDGAKVTDLRTLDTSPLVFALINAVKELSAEIEALKARIPQPR